MLKKLLSFITLVGGIALAIVVTPTYLMTVGVMVAIMAYSGVGFKRYAIDVWLGFDKFANACLGGSHLETVSSRLGKSVLFSKNTVLGWWWIDWIVYRLLDYVDKNHCGKAIDWSVGQPYERL